MKKIISIYIVLALLISCSGEAPKEEVKAEVESEHMVSLDSAQAYQAEVTTTNPVQKVMSGTIRVNGKIDVPPQNMYSLSVPMGGYLKSTKLLPGMHFNKGEVIAVMEDPLYVELQQNYLISVSQLEVARLEWLRQKELNQSKASSDKSLQQASQSYEELRIRLRGYEEKLQLLGINPGKLTEENLSSSVPLRAPMNGFVAKVNVNIGKYVNPSDVMFELVNPEDIHLSLTVFEKDLPNIEIGQKVLAYTNNNPEVKYPCEVILVGKELAADRSVAVHCHFERYDKKLVPGTYMNAEIELAGRKVMALPEESVVTLDGKEFIFVKKGKNVFELTEVKTGFHKDGYVEIASNASLLQASVVKHGAYTLLMKLKNVADE